MGYFLLTFILLITELVSAFVTDVATGFPKSNRDHVILDSDHAYSTGPDNHLRLFARAVKSRAVARVPAKPAARASVLAKDSSKLPKAVIGAFPAATSIEKVGKTSKLRQTQSSQKGDTGPAPNGQRRYPGKATSNTRTSKTPNSRVLSGRVSKNRSTKDRLSAGSKAQSSSSPKGLTSSPKSDSVTSARSSRVCKRTNLGHICSVAGGVLGVGGTLLTHKKSWVGTGVSVAGAVVLQAPLVRDKFRKKLNRNQDLEGQTQNTPPNSVQPNNPPARAATPDTPTPQNPASRPESAQPNPTDDPPATDYGHPSLVSPDMPRPPEPAHLRPDSRRSSVAPSSDVFLDAVEQQNPGPT